ncbi:hypothetical protein BCR44DRAFT_1511673, partial [Catenaria anguillulae PL171]
ELEKDTNTCCPPPRPDRHQHGRPLPLPNYPSTQRLPWFPNSPRLPLIRPSPGSQRPLRF